MKTKHQIAAWYDAPDVYHMMVPDELILNGATVCEPDKIALTTCELIWPATRGTFEILKLDDPRYLEAVDASFAKLKKDLPADDFEVTLTDREKGIFTIKNLACEAPKPPVSNAQTFVAVRRHLRIAIFKLSAEAERLEVQGADTQPDPDQKEEGSHDD